MATHLICWFGLSLFMFSTALPASASLLHLPAQLPAASSDGIIRLAVRGTKLPLTVQPALQQHLSRFIASRGNPIAAVVVVDVATGAILALAQGRQPQQWGQQQHTALFTEFPAASLFKIVTTAAWLETAGAKAEQPLGFAGGCGEVRADGTWIRGNTRRKFSLPRAYALSCNGYYASIAINHLGLGIITQYAQRLRFGASPPADFYIPPSPLTPPTAANVSAHTVGEYAAGFGRVGISALHAAWLHLVIASGGKMRQLKILPPQVGAGKDSSTAENQLLAKTTSATLLRIMAGTVNGGSATYAFRSRKYHRLRRLIGGKTGTLYSKALSGINTWFAGLMPVANPRVVVAAVVVIPNAWIIKGPNLAAEAFWAYQHLYRPPHPAIALQKRSVKLR